MGVMNENGRRLFEMGGGKRLELAPTDAMGTGTGAKEQGADNGEDSTARVAEPAGVAVPTAQPKGPKSLVDVRQVQFDALHRQWTELHQALCEVTLARADLLGKRLFGGLASKEAGAGLPELNGMLQEVQKAIDEVRRQRAAIVAGGAEK
jgi:hypothetical protein